MMYAFLAIILGCFCVEPGISATSLGELSRINRLNTQQMEGLLRNPVFNELIKDALPKDPYAIETNKYDQMYDDEALVLRLLPHDWLTVPAGSLGQKTITVSIPGTWTWSKNDTNKFMDRFMTTVRECVQKKDITTAIFYSDSIARTMEDFHKGTLTPEMEDAIKKGASGITDYVFEDLSQRNPQSKKDLIRAVYNHFPNLNQSKSPDALFYNMNNLSDYFMRRAVNDEDGLREELRKMVGKVTDMNLFKLANRPNPLPEKVDERLKEFTESVVVTDRTLKNALDNAIGQIPSHNEKNVANLTVFLIEKFIEAIEKHPEATPKFIKDHFKDDYRTLDPKIDESALKFDASQKQLLVEKHLNAGNHFYNNPKYIALIFYYYDLFKKGEFPRFDPQNDFHTVNFGTYVFGVNHCHQGQKERMEQHFSVLSWDESFQKQFGAAPSHEASPGFAALDTALFDKLDEVNNRKNVSINTGSYESVSLKSFLYDAYHQILSDDPQKTFECGTIMQEIGWRHKNVSVPDWWLSNILALHRHLVGIAKESIDWESYETPDYAGRLGLGKTAARSFFKGNPIGVKTYVEKMMFQSFDTKGNILKKVYNKIKTEGEKPRREAWEIQEERRQRESLETLLSFYRRYFDDLRIDLQSQVSQELQILRNPFSEFGWFDREQKEVTEKWIATNNFWTFATNEYLSPAPNPVILSQIDNYRAFKKIDNKPDRNPKEEIKKEELSESLRTPYASVRTTNFSFESSPFKLLVDVHDFISEKLYRYHGKDVLTELRSAYQNLNSAERWLNFFKNGQMTQKDWEESVHDITKDFDGFLPDGPLKDEHNTLKASCETKPFPDYDDYDFRRESERHRFSIEHMEEILTYIKDPKNNLEIDEKTQELFDIYNLFPKSVARDWVKIKNQLRSGALFPTWFSHEENPITAPYEQLMNKSLKAIPNDPKTPEDFFKDIQQSLKDQEKKMVDLWEEEVSDDKNFEDDNDRERKRINYEANLEKIKHIQGRLNIDDIRNCLWPQVVRGVVAGNAQFTSFEDVLDAWSKVPSRKDLITRQDLLNEIDKKYSMISFWKRFREKGTKLEGTYWNDVEKQSKNIYKLFFVFDEDDEEVSDFLPNREDVARNVLKFKGYCTEGIKTTLTDTTLLDKHAELFEKASKDFHPKFGTPPIGKTHLAHVVGKKSTLEAKEILSFLLGEKGIDERPAQPEEKNHAKDLISFVKQKMQTPDIVHFIEGRMMGLWKKLQYTEKEEDVKSLELKVKHATGLLRCIQEDKNPYDE